MRITLFALFLANTLLSLHAMGEEASLDEIKIFLKSESGGLPEGVKQRISKEPTGRMIRNPEQLKRIWHTRGLPVEALKAMRKYLRAHELRDTSMIESVLHRNLLELDGTTDRMKPLWLFQECADAGIIVLWVGINEERTVVHAEVLMYAFPEAGGIATNKTEVMFSHTEDSGKYMVTQW